MGTQAYVSDQLASLLVGKPGGIGKTVTISDPVTASCMAMMDTYLTIMEPKLYPVSTELAGLCGSHIGGMIGGGGPFPPISAFVKDAGLVDAGVGLPTGAKCAVDADCASGSCPKCVATNDKNIKPFKKARMTDNRSPPCALCCLEWACASRCVREQVCSYGCGVLFVEANWKGEEY